MKVDLVKNIVRLSKKIDSGKWGKCRKIFTITSEISII